MCTETQTAFSGCSVLGTLISSKFFNSALHFCTFSTIELSKSSSYSMPANHISCINTLPFITNGATKPRGQKIEANLLRNPRFVSFARIKGKYVFLSIPLYSKTFLNVFTVGNPSLISNFFAQSSCGIVVRISLRLTTTFLLSYHKAPKTLSSPDISLLLPLLYRRMSDYYPQMLTSTQNLQL